MSDKEPTHQLTHFENMVLQRFDQIDARLTTLESKAVDTKPIWEQALAHLLEVKAEIVEIKAEIVEVKTRLTDIDKRLHRVERAMGILSEDVVHVRADLRGFDDRITALEGQ